MKNSLDVIYDLIQEAKQAPSTMVIDEIHDILIRITRELSDMDRRINLASKRSGEHYNP